MLLPVHIACCSLLSFLCPFLCPLTRSPAAQVDVRGELSSLLRSHQYEQAFARALGLQDVATVGWLCTQVRGAGQPAGLLLAVHMQPNITVHVHTPRNFVALSLHVARVLLISRPDCLTLPPTPLHKQADAAAVLSRDPCPLSQMVLLSLVQQVSADLTTHLAPKLAWIREAALQLNPKDPVLARHLRPVLEGVHAALAAAAARASGPDAASCRLALHVVHSQMTS